MKMGMWGQAAFWVVLALVVWVVVFSVMEENTTKVFNAGVRGLAQSGGDISADSIIDIYAGARERSRDKFTKRDLAKIEHKYLWIVAAIAGETDPKLRVSPERLRELQVTASELRTELKLLASPLSTERARQ